jgi:hypothetical protein
VVQIFAVPELSAKWKHCVCDTRGPCQTIRSIMKPVFWRFRDLLYLRDAEMPRCPDLEFFCW